MSCSLTEEAYAPTNTDQEDQHPPTSRPPAILRLPLELRQEIYFWALQDTIISKPRHPYDDESSFPERRTPLEERFLPLTSLRLVSRQFHIEVDHVFQRDIVPNTIFYFFGVTELPMLCKMRRRLRSHPYLRRARFYLRSPDKEAICFNDDNDGIWDTLIESQAGCEELGYEVEADVIAEWTLSTAPTNRTIRRHLPEECGCDNSAGQKVCLPYASIPYPSLANSLRLSSLVWTDCDFPYNRHIENMTVCSTLEGKFEDLDLDAFERLARQRYRRIAVESRPPPYWRLYGDGDVERKNALKTELIDVGAEWVVEEQHRHWGNT